MTWRTNPDPLYLIITTFSKHSNPWKACLFVLLTFFFSPILEAQNNLYPFTQYTVEDGLASMETYSIVQDEKGYIWIGTDAGLSRFDGYNFRNFTTKDGLTNNDIVGLYHDSRDRLWVQSLNSLGYLRKDSFHIFQPEGFTFDPYWFSFMEIDEQRLLISAKKQIYTVNEQLELKLFEQIRVDQDDRTYYKIFPQEGKNFWLAMGAYFYQMVGDEIVDSLPLRENEKLGKRLFLKHYKEHLFYTNTEGLVYVNLKERSYQNFMPSLRTISSLEIYDGRLWIVDSEKGLWMIDLNSEEQFSPKLVLDEVLVSTISRDRAGNIWIPTYGSGVYYLPINSENIRVLNEQNGLGTTRIEKVEFDGNKLWIGTGDNAFCTMENNQIEHIPLSYNSDITLNRVMDFEFLTDGQVLLGTDNGLFRFDGKSTFKITKNNAKALDVSDDKKVLLSTSFGVYQLPLESVISSKEDTTINLFACTPPCIKKQDGRSYAVFKDRDGQLWMDNTAQGLISIKDEIIFNWSQIASAFRSSSVEILQLNNGLIAIASQGEGVLLIKGKDYLQIGSEQGLSSDICNDMISDGQTLWVATNRGMSTIRDINFEEGKYQIDVYNTLDGLITNEIKSIARNDSLIYLGTALGLMELNESELSDNTLPPNIDITNVIINERDTLIQQNYQLAFGQNNIRIHFVGLSFNNQGNLLYEYQLEGVDEDWIKTTALETHYSNLRPGKYTFKVKASGQQNLKGSDPQILSFQIKPAFNQTIWFKWMIGLGGLIGLSIIAYTFYSNVQRQVLKKKVDKKTKELNEKLIDLADLNEKLERSNKELEEFAHVASHDLKSPLRNVAGFIQLLKRRGKERLIETDLEFIDLAVKGVKHMENVINNLLSMSKVNQQDMRKEEVDLSEVVNDIVKELQIELVKQNAKVEVSSDLPVVYFSFTNAKQLFQNLISNALKYQDKIEPIVEIGYRPENGHYEFYVKDNGIGMDMEYKSKVFLMFQRLHTEKEFSGTGIGLSICKKIVENNKGQIWFESKIGEGTTFYFTLPREN